ncbi:DUF4388 domain-containing protein [Tumidithrix elongata RA019]|uniref:DUF4388 domain-containing protein n=1 Tax=Tumidithrix elongata BACA0141 TaxID=2716417 RepID=A0AAW9QBC7_9CYAN|nr:DUF4388 domain-containing protein [Tumidithrix elongata RA019]
MHQGRVVATADRLDSLGLSTMLEQRGWLKNLSPAKEYTSCSLDMPLGIHLKSQGILQTEHLKILFNSQVVKQVCTVFHLTDGQFRFDPTIQTPKAEMTGLSLPATEATLMGLRGLRNWTSLNEKLPAPDSSIFATISGKPQLRLDPQEWQIWEFANGTLTLRSIAAKLQLPIEKVQQIAFRLIVVGLAEEDPGCLSATNANEPEQSLPEPIEETPEVNETAGREVVSNSFIKNLLGFLQNKV